MLKITTMLHLLKFLSFNDLFKKKISVEFTLYTLKYLAFGLHVEMFPSLFPVVRGTLH